KSSKPNLVLMKPAARYYGTDSIHPLIILSVVYIAHGAHFACALQVINHLRRQRGLAADGKTIICREIEFRQFCLEFRQLSIRPFVCHQSFVDGLQSEV